MAIKEQSIKTSFTFAKSIVILQSSVRLKKNLVPHIDYIYTKSKIRCRSITSTSRHEEGVSAKIFPSYFLMVAGIYIQVPPFYKGLHYHWTILILV